LKAFNILKYLKNSKYLHDLGIYRINMFKVLELFKVFKVAEVDKVVKVCKVFRVCKVFKDKKIKIIICI
jgi:hypothetical protein